MSAGAGPRLARALTWLPPSRLNNTYALAPGGKYFHWMNNLRTVQEWKGYGQDTGGTFN